MKIKISTLIIIMIAIDYVGAQTRKCGYSDFLLSNIQSKIEKDSIRKILAEKKMVTEVNSRGNKSIPVVFHVIYSNESENVSDEKILNQLESLNRDFNGENIDRDIIPNEFKQYSAKGKIKFCLAERTIEGKYQIGIVKIRTEIKEIGIKENLYYDELGGSDSWSSEHFLNVWIASTGNVIAGFGTYPEIVENDKQGVVIHPKYFGSNNSLRYNLGRTLVHEIGHFLGLDHLDGDNAECEAGDNIDDTPMQDTNYIGCPNYPQYSCGTSDMFMNYMNYVDDGCMVMFTEEQLKRMTTTLNTYRPDLLTTGSCYDYNVNNKITSFRLYPNPVEDNLTIDFGEKSLGISNIMIFSVTGQLIYQQKHFLLDKVEIDLSKTLPGVYIVVINNVSQKLLVI